MNENHSNQRNETKQEKTETYIDDQLSEPNQLGSFGEQESTKAFIFGFHQQIPRQIQTVLFGNGTIVILLGHIQFFLDQLSIGHTLVVYVMDQGTPSTSKLSQWIRCDAYRYRIGNGADAVSEASL